MIRCQHCTDRKKEEEKTQAKDKRVQQGATGSRATERKDPDNAILGARGNPQVAELQAIHNPGVFSEGVKTCPSVGIPDLHENGRNRQ